MLAEDWKPCDVLTSRSWRCSIKLSYVTDNLVLRSARNCAGLRKWSLTRRARSGRSTILKLAVKRRSLKRKENWRKLLLGIQTGNKLAKPPLFVSYSQFCSHFAILPGEVVSCRDLILRSVATFWVMSLVGIHPGRASIFDTKCMVLFMPTISAGVSNFNLGTFHLMALNET